MAGWQLDDDDDNDDEQPCNEDDPFESVVMTTTIMNDALYTTLHGLPKVELHVHLNGFIREQTLLELAAERSVELPSRYFATTTCTRKDVQQTDGLLYNRLPRSLNDCFAMFAEIPKAVNDLVALKRIVSEALEDFALQNTVYLELRSTPKRLVHDFRSDPPVVATKRDYITTILSVMEDMEAQEEARYVIEKKTSKETNAVVRLPMKSRFIVSIDRSQSLEEANENVQLAIEFLNESSASSSLQRSRIVGMDLGGNPTKQDFSLFAPCFDKAREHGLRITLHCAEIPCDLTNAPAYYQEASSILDFGPDRLGHALLLPPDLQERLLSLRIPIETCPTSNVMTLELARHEEKHLTLLEGLSQHENLRQWLLQSHPLAICTDDPGVFGTTLTTELWLVAKTFGWDQTSSITDEPQQPEGNGGSGLSSFWVHLARRCMEYAFCDNLTKEIIRAQLMQASPGVSTGT